MWIGGENKFIDSEFLWTIHRSLQPDGLLNMVTDDEPYCRQILHQIFQLRDLGAFESQVQNDAGYQHPKSQLQPPQHQQQESAAAGGKRRFINNKPVAARSDGQASTRELFTHVLPKEFLGRSSFFDRLFLNGRKVKRFFMSFKKHGGFEFKYRRYIRRYVGPGRWQQPRREAQEGEEKESAERAAEEDGEAEPCKQDAAVAMEVDADDEAETQVPADKPPKQDQQDQAVSSKRKLKKRRGKKKKSEAAGGGDGDDEDEE